MRTWLAVAAATMACAGSTEACNGDAQEKVIMAQSSAPARPGDAAIAEELEAARRAGTAAAYDRFIARHGNHPLARTARQERDRLAGPRPSSTPHTPGSDYK